MQVSAGGSLNQVSKYGGHAAAQPGGGRGVLEGAFALLGAVEQAREAGLTRLAADSGLPKATAYRLLEKLVELGAVARSGSNYTIGPLFFRLGQAWQPCPELRAAAAGPIRSLAANMGLTASVSVLSEGRLLSVVGAPGEVEPEAVRPGATGPWSTAAGKVLVAGANPGVPLGPLPKGWRQTAAAIRDRGLAFDREEVSTGVCCVATPVYDSGGKTVAALCVLTDPSDRLARLAAPVQAAGRHITGSLRRP